MRVGDNIRDVPFPLMPAMIDAVLAAQGHADRAISNQAVLLSGLTDAERAEFIFLRNRGHGARAAVEIIVGRRA